MLAWCLSGHLCPTVLGFQCRSAHAIVIFSSGHSCSHTHRKELVLAAPSPWVSVVLGLGQVGQVGQVGHAECWGPYRPPSVTGLSSGSS